MTDILLSVPSDDPKLPSWVEVPAAQVTGIPDSPDDIGAATAEQGARADSAVQPTDLPAFGTAATTDADDYATAEQGALADATKVQQVTLTAPLAYALPVGTPANTVHRVTFTQDGVGGHTVTYDGQPVSVDLTSGASTTVELHPVGAGHAIRYPVTNLDAQVSALAEDRGSTLGASLSSTYVAMADFLALLTEDPDNPGLYLLTYPTIPDTTPPTAGTLAGSDETDDGFTLTVTGATDETALDAAPYAFSTDNGATWTAYQAGATYAATGLDPETDYTCLHRVKDAAGNVSTGEAIIVTTAAAAGPLVFDSFTRADNPSTLGNAETGQAWQVGGGTWGVIGGKAYCSASDGINNAYIDVGTADFAATVTFSTVTIPRSALYVRGNKYVIANSASTGYRYQIGPAAADIPGPVIPANGDVIKFQCQGLNYKIWINGVLKVDQTGTAGSDTTARISSNYSTLSRYDDFTVEAI